MIPKVIIYTASLMLLIGLLPMPYYYYNLLRICICGLFGLLAYNAHLKGSKALPWLFGFVAVTFNPLIKIHFPKEVWAAIDVVSAAILVVTVRHTCNKETTLE
jgi:hypothetical protein